MTIPHPLFDELSDNEIELKICRRCGESKHKDDFAHRAFNKAGGKEYKNYCKTLATIDACPDIFCSKPPHVPIFGKLISKATQNENEN